MFPEFAKWFSAGFIVFARLLGFIRFAPVFNRKEIAGLVKLAFAFILTLMLTPLLHPSAPPSDVSPLLLIILNFAVGAIIGYIAQLLILAIESGGDMINTQMGLSSAMVMDPSTNSQTSILSRIITLLGILIFIELGGFYWLINALGGSFEMFPVYAVSIPLEKIINLKIGEFAFPMYVIKGFRDKLIYVIQVFINCGDCLGCFMITLTRFNSDIKQLAQESKLFKDLIDILRTVE